MSLAAGQSHILQEHILLYLPKTTYRATATVSVMMLLQGGYTPTASSTTIATTQTTSLSTLDQHQDTIDIIPRVYKSLTNMVIRTCGCVIR